MLPLSKYTRFVHREYPPFFASLIYAGLSNSENHLKVLGGQPFQYRDAVISDYDWYYTEADLQKAHDVTREYWLKPGVLTQIDQQFSEWEAELEASLSQDLAAYTKAYITYMPTLMLFPTIQDQVESTLREWLLEAAGQAEAERLMDVLNTPERDNFFKTEEYELVTAKDLAAHVQKFAWLNSRYGRERPYTLEMAKNRLLTIDKEKFLYEWEAQKQAVRKAVEEAKALLSPEQAHMVDVMQFIVFYRTQRTDVLNRSSYLYMPKLKEYAAQKGLTYNQLLFCTYLELLQELPDLKIIKARQDDQALLLEDGIMRIVHGAESQAVRQHVREEHAQVKELKGTIACKGVVQGRVKVVRSIDDYNKVGAGDILVATMTTPMMIPIMKLAAGFVTDEGGITCHAAIISREMRKPCIIGTKIATRVLRDGAQVTLNATEGRLTVDS